MWGNTVTLVMDRLQDYIREIADKAFNLLFRAHWNALMQSYSRDENPLGLERDEVESAFQSVYFFMTYASQTLTMVYVMNHELTHSSIGADEAEATGFGLWTASRYLFSDPAYYPRP